MIGAERDTHRRQTLGSAATCRLLLICCCVLAVSWAVTGRGRAHEGEQVDGGEGAAEGSALFDTPCVNGLAGPYPCRNVNLLAFLPQSTMGGGKSTSDLWGWTDPQTGKEYALLGRSTGTAFVDLSDPTDPIYVGSLPTQTVESPWREIKVYQNYAFIVSEAAFHGMQVFDLTQLRAVATPLVTFTPTAHYAGFSTSHNVVLNEASGFAYAVGTNTCSGGLHMIDVHDPLHPVFAGCFSADGYSHDAQCVTYGGPDSRYSGHEICFNSNEDTLTIVDVTNKNTPVLLSRSGYSGWGYVHQGWLTEDQAYFLLDDEYDEINSNHNTWTYVWDVSNLRVLQLVGHYAATSPAIDHNLFTRRYAHGEYVFEANYRAGLRILRLDDLAHAAMHEVGYFDIFPADDAQGFEGAWGNYPFFASGLVIVSGIKQGLFVLQPVLGTDVPTPAPTPTPTPTVAAAYGVSGHIRYHGSGLPVAGAAVHLDGAAPSVVQTDNNGRFMLSGLGGNQCEVHAEKVGDAGAAINAVDAVMALYAAVGAMAPDAEQQLACDVSGDGQISAVDAVFMLQYRVGLIASFPVAQACGSDWAFRPVPAAAPNQELTDPLATATGCQPGAIRWKPLTATATDQDFSAVLFGDCSGNWSPGTGSVLPGRQPGAGSSGRAGAVRLGTSRSARRGGALRVPLYVHAANPFHSFDLQLGYDPARLRLVGLRRVGRARRALAAVNQRVPGFVAVSLASAEPLRSGAVLVLQFEGRDGAGSAVRVINATVGEN